MSDSEDEIYIGEVLNGRWKVIEALGGGAFGRVFLGLDTDTTNPVAIKILKLSRSTAPVLLEFQDEGRYLERLGPCARVVDMHENGTHSAIFSKANAQLPLDVHYIVFELADETLVNLLTLDEDEFPWNQRMGIYRDVAHGIHQMHLNRVVNRDLKSENILLFEEEKYALRGKVADLGRARILTEGSRLRNDDYRFGRGDPRFAAPELVWHQGEPTDISWRAIDLYHLGSVLFELATGFGLTGYIIPNPDAAMSAFNQLDAREREEFYRAISPDLRGKYEVAYEIFAESVPESIRFSMVALLKQLTELNPEDRFPITRGQREWPASLDWLLRRIDIISLQLYRAEVEARRNQKKKKVAA